MTIPQEFLAAFACIVAVLLLLIIFDRDDHD